MRQFLSPFSSYMKRVGLPWAWYFLFQLGEGVIYEMRELLAPAIVTIDGMELFYVAWHWQNIQVEVFSRSPQVAVSVWSSAAITPSCAFIITCFLVLLACLYSVTALVHPKGSLNPSQRWCLILLCQTCCCYTAAVSSIPEVPIQTWPPIDPAAG